jgi:hypothetical protein
MQLCKGRRAMPSEGYALLIFLILNFDIVPANTLSSQQLICCQDQEHVIGRPASDNVFCLLP